MTEISELTSEALETLPLFPLPSTVLMPGTFISLHIFEPRYRTMMEAVIEGHRLLAMATLNQDSPIDAHGRPAIHPIGGLGVLRRSIRLPDGRYNIVLEGVARVDLTDELPPDRVYRRARGRIIEDAVNEPPEDLDMQVASLRALAVRILSDAGNADEDVLESLNDIKDAGILTDVIAAAALQESDDRLRALSEPRVDRRVALVAGALGEMLLERSTNMSSEGLGWGVVPGKA